jgi:hypothetical protein
MSKYHYKLINTNESSKKYGNCEICGQYATEMFHQIEEKYFKNEFNGENYEGWTEGKSYFGHKDCLEKIRRSK